MTDELTREPDQKKGKRLLSVDLLRGLTIGFMILVNDPGNEKVSYRALDHAPWNGFTPTDLVFPTFLFLVGVSLVLSFARREAEGYDRSAFLWHALRRTLLLLALGIMLNGFPFYHLHTWRFYGVLQRIALCFGTGSVLLAFTRNNARRVVTFVSVLVVALVGYWLIMRFLPVPGFGVPGRDIPLLDRDANLVAWIDRHLMPGHLYEGTRDPEGLLSTLPSIGTIVLGMLTGIWLRTTRTAGTKAAGLLTAGISALLLGGLWNFAMPINKKLWTSSYVLWAGGWSLLLLALFFWLSDVKNWRGRGWTPFLVFGRNAITAYVVAEMIAIFGFLFKVQGHPVGGFVYTHVFKGIGSPAFGSMLFSIFFVALCWVPMALLYRRKIFLKL